VHVLKTVRACFKDAAHWALAVVAVKQPRGRGVEQLHQLDTSRYSLSSWFCAYLLHGLPRDSSSTDAALVVLPEIFVSASLVVLPQMSIVLRRCHTSKRASRISAHRYLLLRFAWRSNQFSCSMWHHQHRLSAKHLFNTTSISFDMIIFLILKF
jgi:hypothetical protein